MSNQLVTIATFPNSLEAALAKQTLEAENIPAFVMDNETVTTAWHLSIAVGLIKLKVPQSYLEEAVDILTAYNIDINPEFNQTEADIDLGENQPETELENETISQGDRILNQAFKVAVIGLCIFPFLLLQLYSLSLLVYLLFTGLPISAKNKWKLGLTVIFNILAIYVLWVLVAAIFN